MQEKDEHKRQALFPVTKMSGLMEGELGQDFFQGQSKVLGLRDARAPSLLSRWDQVGTMWGGGGELCMCLWKEIFLVLHDFSPKVPKLGIQAFGICQKLLGHCLCCVTSGK